MEHYGLSEITPTTLWEMAKTALRGRIIPHCVYRKRKRIKQENNLEIKLKQLHHHFASHPSDQILQEINETSKKFQLDNIINQKTQFLLQRLRYNNFAYKYKAGKHLANQLRRNKEENTIATMKDPAGNTHHDPLVIN